MLSRRFNRVFLNFVAACTILSGCPTAVKMAQIQQKKFVIKSFKNIVAMDVSAAQTTWASLSRAIDEIYNKNQSVLKFEELYRAGYNMVLHKHGEMLYNEVASTVRQHLQKTVEEVSATPTEQLMQTIAKAWGEHKVSLCMVADILMYLDRTYVIQHKKVTVYNMSLQIFRDVVTYHPSVRDRLRAILLDSISVERNGCLIDRDLMKTVLAMLVDLGVDGVSVYEEDFERHFLEATRNFYRLESNEYLAQNTCPGDFNIRVLHRDIKQFLYSCTHINHSLFYLPPRLHA